MISDEKPSLSGQIKSRNKWVQKRAIQKYGARPNDDSTAPPYRYDEDMRQNRPINMFRYPLSPTDRLRTAQARMAKIVERTEQIERYVTSKRFDLDSEFSKMQK